jgi:endonuclease
MAALNEKPVRLLIPEMIRDMGLKPGDAFSRDDAINWFKSHYPNIKEGTVSAHLIRFSTNAPTRLHYSARPGAEDLLFKIDGSHFRLYEAGKDPLPITQANPKPESVSAHQQSEDDSSEFAYEHDLRDYLARNLHLIEPGLNLYVDDGVTGVEFPVGGRFIDILAIDKAGNYVVIELKVSKGYDRVVGQLLRYMTWIEEHQADPGQTARGVIVAKEISQDLRLACKRITGVQLFEYALSVTLKPVAQ